MINPSIDAQTLCLLHTSLESDRSSCGHVVIPNGHKVLLLYFKWLAFPSRSHSGFSHLNKVSKFHQSVYHYIDIAHIYNVFISILMPLSVLFYIGSKIISSVSKYLTDKIHHMKKNRY